MLQGFDGLGRIWLQLGATQQYYPLLHSAFWLEHHLWGDAVFGYHLLNVLLHATAACLLVLIARRLSLAGAWIAGFVFALHPVCVEAVAWISEQKSTLSGVFCLGAALGYLHFDQTRRRRTYLLALGLFVLALLSKTVTATLPAALLVVLWWKCGRLEWKRDLRPLAGWIVIGATAGLFTAWVERTYVGAHGADYVMTTGQRLLLAPRAICFYACKLVLPLNLTFTYPRWDLDPHQWWQYLFPLGLLAVTVWFVILARRNRGPLASLLIFAGTLFPVLGFFSVYPFAYSWVADHFQYLASLAIILPVTAFAAAHLSRTAARNIAAAVVAILAELTWLQAGMYRDGETLYRETLRRNPTSYMAHNNLGNLLVEMPGRNAEAIAEFRAALRIRPNNAEAHNNLANALSQDPARLDQAIAEYRAALRLKPMDAEAHSNLASALTRTGRVDEAIAEAEKAVRLQPNDAKSHNNLAGALIRVPGRTDDAIAEYRTALRLDPDLQAAHFNLADALARIPGQLPEAIAEFREALRLDPEDVEARVKLGNALLQVPGGQQEAVEEFRTALRMRPDYGPALAALQRLGAQ
ncbi:MAG TPA: tetratricopeptide repeat protein [Bryobacteraceae bacterium]|nr:tetratricopeptide repeat protein [Bryobacteraceae bacterium]